MKRSVNAPHGVKPKKYSVDRMMHNTALSLIRDFQTNLNDQSFCSNLRTVLMSEDIKEIRRLEPQTNADMSVAEFKATYQMASLFKRYRHQPDVYSDNELTEKAIFTFKQTQDRIRAVNFDQLDASTKLVLDCARIYIAETLGVYDDEECRNLCRFGRRASVGVPARAASEAARWELPISGSSEQIAWFDSEMSQVECVQEYWAAQKNSDLRHGIPARPIYQVIDSLKLMLVPKTYKSLRAIMPNTTIGSYMSYGLGEIMRKRLLRGGYDIRSLQMRHRSLARLASTNDLLVTADLSSASDSISVALVNYLFPSDWVDILTKSRIEKVELPTHECIESQTFCTMGIGFTFPLQTLVFLALLKAIQAISFNRLDRRTISVYGDDMIYSYRQHALVLFHFEKLGFVLNVDKTFAQGHFRESCGGDYYRGVDVRPFQPQNGSATVGKLAYEAMLYKFINGLLARWTEHEIEGTLDFLASEIVSVCGALRRVPSDYPDDSGVKCPTIKSHEFLRRTRVTRLTHLGSGQFRFSFLRLVPNFREENRHEPFMWCNLRRLDPVVNYSGQIRMVSDPPVMVLLKRIFDFGSEVSPLLLREVKPVKLIRSELTGKRLRRKLSYVTFSHTGKYKRQSGLSGFEDRG